MPYSGSINSRELVTTVDGFPTKLYIFSAALDNGIFTNREYVKQDLLGILYKHPEITGDPHDKNTIEYAIAMAWGSKENEKLVKAMDIFNYRLKIRQWHEYNPDVEGRVFKNGLHTPEDRVVTCETGTIILGKEAELRRVTKSFYDYLHSWPNLGDLGPVVKDQTG